MKLLEFFCGTKSVSKVFSKYGYKTFSIDNDPQHKPDLCIDILNLEVKNLPKEWRNPTVIWASPPCTSFSVMSIPHYWKNGKPKSYKTFIGLALAKKTIELIQDLKPKYWFIENPTGMLRKQFFMLNLPRKTITYCQYGFKYRKSTDIWNNCFNWIPKKPCKNGSNCHQEARRGMKSGIQGVAVKGLPSMANWKNNAIERGILPPLLIEEIVKACNGDVKIKQNTLK